MSNFFNSIRNFFANLGVVVHRDVDSVMGAVHASIARLKALEQRKTEEAQAHLNAAAASQAAADKADSEAAKAASVGQKLQSLVS
jgi:hypothetical protein